MDEEKLRKLEVAILKSRLLTDALQKSLKYDAYKGYNCEYVYLVKKIKIKLKNAMNLF